MTYDLKREVYDRVVEVFVRCTECTVPEFLPLEDSKMYKIVMPAYIADGGDGYDFFVEYGRNRVSGNGEFYYERLKVRIIF